MKVALRVVVRDVPTGSFGLQDKAGTLLGGEPGSDGVVVFRCDFDAFDPDADAPNLRGPFVHGPPANRFLYLSHGAGPGAAGPWTKRIKVPLASITWPMIRAAASRSGALEADVDGGAAATVRVTWRVVAGG